jgi:hypothetical protein
MALHQRRRPRTRQRAHVDREAREDRAGLRGFPELDLALHVPDAAPWRWLRVEDAVVGRPPVRLGRHLPERRVLLLRGDVHRRGADREGARDEEPDRRRLREQVERLLVRTAQAAEHRYGRAHGIR